MSSQLQKAIAPDGLTQFLLIDAKDVVQESLTRLKAWPPSMIHLGQALMGAGLLHALLIKEDKSKLSLQWSVRGPFGDLYAESNAIGKLRGTIMQPQAPVNNMFAKLGSGILQVRRTEVDSSTGVVQAGGDVCMDLLTYLHQSEQRPCAMNLWVDLNWDDKNPEHPIYVRNALGYLVEVLPDERGVMDSNRLAQWENFLTSLGKLSEWEIDSQAPLASMLKFLNPGTPAKVLMYQNLSFYCSCSEERAQRALILALDQDKSLPRRESEEITCEFCGKVYEV